MNRFYSNLRRGAVLAVAIITIAACENKPKDPKVVAQIEKTTHELDSAQAAQATAKTNAEQFRHNSDSVRGENSKMLIQAIGECRSRIRAQYALSKYFTPAEIELIKKVVVIRECGSWNEAAYNDIMANRGSLSQLQEVLRGVSNADKVKQMQTLLDNKIIDFVKVSDEFHGVYINPKFNNLAEQEDAALREVSATKFNAPELKKIKSAYEANHAKIAQFDNDAKKSDSVAAAINPTILQLQLKLDSLQKVK